MRSRYAQGLRITDEAALTAVKQAAGVLRIEIEAVLSQGLPSSPMAGAQIRVNSGNFITARPIGVRKGVDFQFTGAVRKVDAFAIRGALDAGEVVLVAHVGYSPTGEVFNLAWEDVAENVAVALQADKLLMFTDKLPVDRRGAGGERAHRARGRGAGARKAASRRRRRARSSTPCARSTAASAARTWSRAACRARCCSSSSPHAGVGTMITADPLEKLRPARIEDVGGMLALIEPLEAEGTLVKRSRELLEAEIGNFLVVEHDGAILGCAALYPFPEDKSAEFACLAVAPDYRDAGYGERLLHACEERAKALKLRKLFALTTHAAHWFLEQGFRAGRRQRAALAAPGALQLAPRFEGLFQAHIGAGSSPRPL